MARRTYLPLLALSKAWDKACKTPGNDKIVIPKGEYAMGPCALRGPCKGSIDIEVAGNFMAPADPAAFKGNDAVLKFEYVDHLTITGVGGGGILDGQGHIAWKRNNCAQTGTCNSLPYNFRFNFVTNSVFTGLHSLNSKQFHMNILGCRNLTLNHWTILAPPESLNTDGIHVGRSVDVKIIDINIDTGDDCVSVGDGTKQLRVEKVICGRGHGISIGSLGLYKDEEPVSDIRVTGCTIKNAMNGVRIKSWLNSYPNVASDLHFTDIIVENVTTAIMLDQGYCPYGKCGKKAPSKVRLENISFKNVRGWTSSQAVVKLVGSSAAKASKVEMADIDLTFHGANKAVSECCNIKPLLSGKMNPPACTQHVSEYESA
ncbi:hypothetical protein V2J09_000094 [Rumex salicifolius]